MKSYVDLIHHSLTEFCNIYVYVCVSIILSVTSLIFHIKGQEKQDYSLIISQW